MPFAIKRLWQRPTDYARPSNIPTANEALPIVPKRNGAGATRAEKKDERTRYPASWWIVGTLGAFLLGIFLRTWSNETNAALTMLATAVMAFYTRTLFVSTAKMQETTADTLEHMRREFDADHRPWIEVSITPGSALTWNADGGCELRIQIMTQNVGDVPAVGVSPWAECCIWGTVPGAPADAQRRLSERHPRKRLPPSPGSHDLGIVLFPRRGYPTNWPLSVDAEAVRKSLEETQPVFKDDRINLCVVGLVTYRAAHSDTVYQTGFILTVLQTVPNRAGEFAISQSTGAIPSDRLILRPHEFLTPIIT
jgi:hypothetical protein